MASLEDETAPRRRSSCPERLANHVRVAALPATLLEHVQAAGIGQQPA